MSKIKNFYTPDQLNYADAKVANTILGIKPTIVKNVYAGKAYIGIQYPGNPYVKGLNKMLQDIQPVTIVNILRCNDPNNLISEYFGGIYHKLPNGQVYVNPLIKIWDEESQQNNYQKWLSNKWIAHRLGDRLPTIDLYQMIQDIKILPFTQAKELWDYIMSNYSNKEIQWNLLIEKYPLLKFGGDEFSKENLWDNTNNKYYKDMVEKLDLFKQTGEIQLEYNDNPSSPSWDYSVPNIMDRFNFDRFSGEDLEKSPQLDPERETMLIQRLTAEYVPGNIGWAVARSANCYKCGGPEVEHPYSKLLDDIISSYEFVGLPDPMDFWKYLDIQLGNKYFHLSPDQQAMYGVVHDLMNNTEEVITTQFYTFVGWYNDLPRCAKYITSYHNEIMYGPKWRSYRKDSNGDIIGDAQCTSYEAIQAAQWLRDHQDDLGDFDTNENYSDLLDPIAFESTNDDEFNF